MKLKRFLALPQAPAVPATPAISVPKTADATNMPLWGGLLLVSVIAMAGTVLYRKNN